MSEKQTLVPLYRVENPSTSRKPNGITSHEDLIGQWFTPNLSTASMYLRKSTQTFGKNAGPIDGAQLAIARVPSDQLEALHVSRHPVAKDMDVEADNYLIPRDGSIQITTLPLDDIVGELRGHLASTENQKEAVRRISAALGGIAINA